jgi:hypothetical protein
MPQDGQCCNTITGLACRPGYFCCYDGTGCCSTESGDVPVSGGEHGINYQFNNPPVQPGGDGSVDTYVGE